MEYKNVAANEENDAGKPVLKHAHGHCQHMNAPCFLLSVGEKSACRNTAACHKEQRTAEGYAGSCRVCYPYTISITIGSVVGCEANPHFYDKHNTQENGCRKKHCAALFGP